MHDEPTEYRFQSRSYNAGRIFKAPTWGAAAARVADHLARQSGGRRAGAWTLHHESSSPDYTTRHYTSTAAIPTKQPGEARVVGEHYFTIHLVNIDLAAARITWSRLTTAQIDAVRADAGSAGDLKLVRKADRALARRGGAA